MKARDFFSSRDGNLGFHVSYPKKGFSPNKQPQLGEPYGKCTHQYPLVMINIAIEHGPFSSWIYSLKMVIFHSCLYVYQRVNPIRSHQIPLNHHKFPQIPITRHIAAICALVKSWIMGVTNGHQSVEKWSYWDPLYLASYFLMGYIHIILYYILFYYIIYYLLYIIYMYHIYNMIYYIYIYIILYIYIRDVI